MKKLLITIEDHFCAAILLVMLILTFINVIARYIFLLSMPFVEELTRLGLMILSLVGASVAAKRGAHLGLSAITDLLPAKAQNILMVIADILGALFGVVLTYYGYGMVKNEYINQLKTAGMQWPEWIFGMWVLVGGFFMVVRYTQLAIQKIHRIKGEAEK